MKDLGSKIWENNPEIKRITNQMLSVGEAIWLKLTPQDHNITFTSFWHILAIANQKGFQPNTSLKSCRQVLHMVSPLHQLFLSIQDM